MNTVTSANELQYYERPSDGAVIAYRRAGCEGKVYMRGREHFYSLDGGRTLAAMPPGYSNPTLLVTLTNPSLLLVPRPGSPNRPYLLFANHPLPARHCKDHIARRHLTVRLSEDEGVTWPHALVIEVGTSGYSDLALGADGKTVHILYERGSHRFDEEMVHTSFKIAEVLAARIEPGEAFECAARATRTRVSRSRAPLRSHTHRSAPRSERAPCAVHCSRRGALALCAVQVWSQHSPGRHVSRQADSVHLRVLRRGVLPPERRRGMHRDAGRVVCGLERFFLPGPLGRKQEHEGPPIVAVLRAIDAHGRHAGVSQR